MRRSVKQYDNAIMKRIGELQMAALKAKDETEYQKLKAQYSVLYDVWHEVTHEERVIEEHRPKVDLVEGRFENYYQIFTTILGVRMVSVAELSYKEIKEMKFQIMSIKDR